MAHFHKNCGNQITKFSRINKTAYCPCCEKEVALSDTIADYTLEARISQLKAMHKLMCNANDESIYMSWIYLMPDEPSDGDFVDIALDDEDYNECFDLFVKLIKYNGNRW